MPDLTGVQIIWHYITVVAEWVMNNLLILNALLAIAIVFFQRRDPKTVWTWLLVLYFIPIAGFALSFVRPKYAQAENVPYERNGG